MAMGKQGNDILFMNSTIASVFDTVSSCAIELSVKIIHIAMLSAQSLIRKRKTSYVS